MTATRPAPLPDTPASFADRLLAWHARHGRHNLPWQQPRTPYRVWVSEIMLQQTQVATVIGYFERFMAALPVLGSLAAASEDRVMKLWEGLGYYSRARNLHKAAGICVAQHDGELPGQFDALLALPGIGRSTAGAILAQSFDEPWPILDGNAKRVLARCYGVDGWPGRSVVSNRLWELAEQCLPRQRAADYTQAIMDLGATVCTARRPDCDRCPLADGCLARREGNPELYPGRKPRRERPLRRAWLLLAVDEAGRVLLERRPPGGIWGGLWCPPMIDSVTVPEGEQARPIEHGFTHFRLKLTPVRISATVDAVRDSQTRQCDAEQAAELGVPRPVRVFLDDFFLGRVRWDCAAAHKTTSTNN